MSNSSMPTRTRTILPTSKRGGRAGSNQTHPKWQFTSSQLEPRFPGLPRIVSPLGSIWVIDGERRSAHEHRVAEIRRAGEQSGGQCIDYELDSRSTQKIRLEPKIVSPLLRRHPSREDAKFLNIGQISPELEIRRCRHHVQQ